MTFDPEYPHDLQSIGINSCHCRDDRPGGIKNFGFIWQRLVLVAYGDVYHLVLSNFGCPPTRLIHYIEVTDQLSIQLAFTKRNTSSRLQPMQRCSFSITLLPSNTFIRLSCFDVITSCLHRPPISQRFNLYIVNSVPCQRSDVTNPS